MKPRIFKRGDFWVLRYGYHPRSFWLFGLPEEDRQQVKNSSVAEIICEEWQSAFQALALLARRGELRLS